MAKKKEEKKEEKIVFDLQESLANVSPFLREGLEEYIKSNNLEIKNIKKFNEVLEHYGGF